MEKRRLSMNAGASGWNKRMVRGVQAKARGYGCREVTARFELWRPVWEGQGASALVSAPEPLCHGACIHTGIRAATVLISSSWGWLRWASFLPSGTVGRKAG